MGGGVVGVGGVEVVVGGVVGGAEVVGVVLGGVVGEDEVVLSGVEGGAEEVGGANVVQVLPFGPCSHSQWKEPGVLTHCCWHPPFPS